MSEGITECSIEGGSHSEELQVLVLVAVGALPAADEPVPPLLGAPDGADGLGLLLVLSPQLFDLPLQVLVALQHTPEGDVPVVRQQRGLLHRALAAVGRGLLPSPVAVDLLLEPDVLLEQFLVAFLAFLQVVELLSS